LLRDQRGSLHSVGLALVSFCTLSSAVYVLNDYVDREVDRFHPLKRHRPLADGSVTVQAALLMFGVLLGTGLGVASLLQSDFLLIAVGYVGLNFAYSLV
jgi:decaprenyl-phosphate phosphoribosyltransferase